MKALVINVYRSTRLGDCTNDGISSKHNELYVICEKGNVEIDEMNPPPNLVKLVYRVIGRDVYHLEPVQSPDGAGWMAGGNYVQGLAFCHSWRVLMSDSASIAVPYAGLL